MAPKVAKDVPGQGASTEEKRAAQKRRAAQFGIEALEGKGERLTFGAGLPTQVSDYGDPVNLKFPLVPPGRARNARARFKQFAGTYERESSKRIVHTRIVERLLTIGASPSLNESDPLDAMLPRALKDRMKERARKRLAAFLLMGAF